MIRTATLFIIGTFVLHVGGSKVVAQGDAPQRPLFGDEWASQRIDDYLNLLNQGYSEIEIFQDLGNANLLSQNYDTAAFWFQRLLAFEMEESESASFQERYEYALDRSKGNYKSPDKDWTQEVLQDYRAAGKSKLLQNVAQTTVHGESSLSYAKKASVMAMGNNDYETKLSFTADGNTAFFSKTTAQKPAYGIFSKKEVVHEIYRAERIGGQWRNLTKMSLCPKHYSAKHPSVSSDGTRLFFASNMPGSYGKYDIYVAEIKPDGSLGMAKNLGAKVNTKKNDLHPNAVSGTTLLFASNGRKGHGGLDLFAVSINGNQLGQSKNLGHRVNSPYDDFALTYSPLKKMGFVLSNRGDNKTVAQYSVAPEGVHHLLSIEKDDQKLWHALNNDNQEEYSSTSFEEEEP